jgi:hypothetical protein
MLEALEFGFFQNALLAGLLVSILTGIIGSLIVVNRMVFLAGGIAHTSYGGIGIAVFLGLPIFLGASIFAVLAALLMAIITMKQKNRIDTFIGLIWAVGMALGIILIDLTPGYNVDLMSYLFGSILAVSNEDIQYMSILTLGIIAIITFWYRDFLAVSYDSEYASLRGTNVDPKTHPYISTGLHENKFGVDLDTAKRMYIKAKQSDNLDPVGIHCHIGSQLTELEPIKEAVKITADLVRNLAAALKVELKFFDVGGGLGIVYDDEKLIDTYEYGQAVLDALFGLDVTVVCEPGRFIVGNSGTFVSKVLYEKTNGDKRFVIVDGAMNDLIRPSLYNAYHRVEVIGKTENTSDCNVVGPVCESGDFFAKNVELPLTQHNDLIAVYSAGAYGYTMASNYNTRPKVAEIAIEDGNDRMIRRRETFEDLIAHEEEFLK